jgi:hypothetical protein
MFWHRLFPAWREWRCRACTRREIVCLNGSAMREFGHDLGPNGDQLLFKARKPF